MTNSDNNFERDRHERERHVVFGNEAFAIGMLQAVSGAAFVAALTQLSELTKFVNEIPALLLITWFSFALALAVCAAAFRHKYKMWDVKTAAVSEPAERARRIDRTARYLRNMRRSMDWSTALIVIALGTFVASVWLEAVDHW